MPELLQKILEKLGGRPTTVEEIIQIAKELGHDIAEMAARRYLYVLDYKSTEKNSDIWVREEGARVKRVAEALYRLDDSILCDEEQAFLLEVIHNQHEGWKLIEEALRKQNIDVTIGFVGYNLCKYGGKKNHDGIYYIDGINSELREVADRHYGRKYFPLKQHLAKALKKKPTTRNQAIQIAKSVGYDASTSFISRCLYAINYTPSRQEGKWVYDKNAKLKRAQEALQKLESSILCDEEQCFFLEVINGQHSTCKSIHLALQKRGVGFTKAFVESQIYKQGIVVGKDGNYQVPGLSPQFIKIAKNNNHRQYVSFVSLLDKELDKQPATVNKVVAYAKDLNIKVTTVLATYYLYDLDYTPAKKKGQWIHSPFAKVNEIEIALTSLDVSQICNEEQSFLLEVINHKHDTHESILDALHKRDIQVTLGFVEYETRKHGVSKNADGFYECPQLTKTLYALAKKYDNRVFYPKEQFIIDYAKKHNGNCSVKSIELLLSNEGYEQYHEIGYKSITSCLLRNGFVFQGDGPEKRKKLAFKPNHCHTLIQEAYNAFSFGSSYQNCHAIVLYYVSHKNISKSQLVKLLTKKHGISQLRTLKICDYLRLQSTKNGLRFPNGTNKPNRISRAMFKKVTKNKKPKSIPDQIWEWSNDGKSTLEIQTALNEGMPLHVIEGHLKYKKKNTSKEAASSSGSNEGTQNFLDETIGDQINVKEPYIVKRPAITPEERLNRYNHEQIKKVQKARKAKFQEMLEIGRQLTPAKQTFIYKPHEQKSLEDVFCEVSNQGQYSLSYQISPIQLPEMRNMFQIARAEGRVVQLFSSQEYMYGRTGTDGFTNYRASGGYSNSSGSYTPPLGRGALRTGPGYVTPLTPMASRVAGGYIGAFIVLPHMYTNTKTIISSETNKLEKSSAALNIGVMVGQMWLFTKFIASKYPKTAAVIMVGTAGHHAYKWYDDIGIGRTKSEIYFLNEKEMLKIGMSCIDGRKPVFLQPESKLPSFSEWKKSENSISSK